MRFVLFWTAFLAIAAFFAFSDNESTAEAIRSLVVTTVPVMAIYYFWIKRRRDG